MAIVWITRAVIATAPALEAGLRYVQTHDPTSPLRIGEEMLHRLQTSSESDEQLSAALSDATGYDWHVATITGTFEARRMQISFASVDQTTARDDLRVCTIDLLKGANTTPSDTWLTADFTAAKAAVNAFWTSIGVHFNTLTSLKKIAFYKLGPAVVPPQPPVHSQDYAAAGGATGSTLPPQVAVSVTEMAGEKPHWGRFYLPAPGVGLCNNFGRISGSGHSAIADAADTMYEAFKTAGIPAVVYRRPLPVRTRKDGVELPAREASAWTVDKLQVDDVFDVIRSRRWKFPLLKLQRDIA